MTAPTPIAGLSEIVDRYDLLLCDIWGVIHNGRESFPAARSALARFRAEKGPVVLISNSPRPAAAVSEQLDGLLVPRDAWSTLVTSGDATRVLLAARSPGPAWAIGPERDGTLYDGLGLTFTGPEDAAFVACTGPNDDETETPEDYRETLSLAAGRGLEMVCANPDIVVQRGSKLIYCGGALAQLYETLGGRVQMAGKPWPAIYELAIGQGAGLLGRDVDRGRILCIGDGIPTDLKGANDQGLDVLFVASGIHGAETIGREGLDANAVEALLAKQGTRAAWAIADLAW